jgi:hypothetical protein
MSPHRAVFTAIWRPSTAFLQQVRATFDVLAHDHWRRVRMYQALPLDDQQDEDANAEAVAPCRQQPSESLRWLAAQLGWERDLERWRREYAACCRVRERPSR